MSLISLNQLNMALNAIKQKIKGSRGNWEQNDSTADDYIKNRPFYTDGDTVHQIDIKYIPDSIATEQEVSNAVNNLSNRLSSVAFTGSYSNLTNKPALHTVATSGSYDDLKNIPSFADVATSGSYNDLSNRPVIDAILSETSTRAVQNKVVTENIKQAVLLKYTESVEECALNSVCYGDGKFIAIGYNNDGTSRLFYSTDGTSWIDSSSFTSSDYIDTHWNSVCYGDGEFVAISNEGRVAYSVNGKNWAVIELSFISSAWHEVCYGDGKFIAINFNSNANQIAYSTNGVDWTLINPGISSFLRSICYGDGKFEAIGATGLQYYSTDGINWSLCNQNIDLTRGGGLISVCYGNDKFVAVGYDLDGFVYYGYSIDGINWTYQRVSSIAKYWTSICYGDGKFVAVGGNSDTTDNMCAYSTDGINWIESTNLPIITAWKSVCYNDGKFVVVGNSGSNSSKKSYFAYSIDGINWTNKYLSRSDGYITEEIAEQIKPYLDIDQIAASNQDEVYVQAEEPVDAPIGSIWVDTDAESTGALTTGTVPAVTADDNDKLIQVVNGEYTLVTVENSSIKTYVDNYINEALGGDY